jgi:hypothetical protein
MHVKIPHSDNLGHNCLRLFSPYRKFAYFYVINSMLNHVAILKPPLPQLNVELVSWYITKSCFGVVHNIEVNERIYRLNTRSYYILCMLCSAMFVSKNQLASTCFHLRKNRQSGLFQSMICCF